jgi:hypothetical protein
MVQRCIVGAIVARASPPVPQVRATWRQLPYPPRPRGLSASKRPIAASSLVDRVWQCAAAQTNEGLITYVRQSLGPPMRRSTLHKPSPV